MTENVCANSLHDWPLPADPRAALAVSRSRLRRGWHEVVCIDCAEKGWRASKNINPATDRRKPVA